MELDWREMLSIKFLEFFDVLRRAFGRAGQPQKFEPMGVRCLSDHWGCFVDKCRQPSMVAGRCYQIWLANAPIPERLMA